MGFWENTNQEATFSFWIKANYTGKHTVSFVIYNSSVAQAAGYYKSFTIDVANTWEKKIITIPIQTGITTYANDNERGLVISIVPCASSDRYLSVAEESWTTDEVRTAMVASNSKNFCDTVGNTLQTTGWQLEEGTVPTPFEHRPYGTELALCQRYLQIIDATGAGGALTIGSGLTRAANNNHVNIPLATTMRAKPGLSVSSTGRLRFTSGGNYADSSPGSIEIGGQTPSVHTSAQNSNITLNFGSVSGVGVATNSAITAMMLNEGILYFDAEI